jgi:hypothetical protein
MAGGRKRVRIEESVTVKVESMNGGIDADAPIFAGAARNGAASGDDHWATGRRTGWRKHSALRMG